MTQRNPMNERYNDENRSGKTRKSSASAKPKATRAATVRDPAPKTKKQKKEEARERERKAAKKADAMSQRFEQTAEYKSLRRIWWVLLVGAIVSTAISWLMTRNETLASYSGIALVCAYMLIIAAFWLDLGKIRKMRKQYNASLASDNSKAARREQKRLRAEMREQEKEAAEKYEAAKAEEEAKKSTGLLARFRKKKETPANEEGSEPSKDEAKPSKEKSEPSKDEAKPSKEKSEPSKDEA